MTISHDTTMEALIAARDEIAATFANPFNSDAAVVFTVSIDGIVIEIMRAPDSLYMLLSRCSGWLSL